MSYRPQLLTTKGDLPGFSTLATRVGVGSNTQVLTANSAAGAGFDWEAAGAGAMTQIADVVVAGTTTTNVTFSSIPGTYKHLVLKGSGRCSEAVVDDYALLRFNADSGANYMSQVGVFTGSGTTTTPKQATNGATSAVCADVACASATANLPGVFTITIPCYVDTTFDKGFLSHSMLADSTTAPLTVFGGGLWLSTAAVTQIDLIAPAAGHWIAGSHVTLYGVN